MNDTLEGPPILSAIKASGVEVVVSVPDIVTSEGLLRPISTDPDLRRVRVCKEDEGVSICAALSYCGVRALLMMQQTGMYDSMNAIRAIAAGYGLPVCMLIGLQGTVAEEDPRRSDKHIVRCALPGSRRRRGRAPRAPPGGRRVGHRARHRGRLPAFPPGGAVHRRHAAGRMSMRA